MREHQRLEQHGVDVRIFARYDWSVARKWTTSLRGPFLYFEKVPSRSRERTLGMRLGNGPLFHYFIGILQTCFLLTRDFFRLYSTFARLYDADASPASCLRSAGSFAINTHCYCYVTVVINVGGYFCDHWLEQEIIIEKRELFIRVKGCFNKVSSMLKCSFFCIVSLACFDSNACRRNAEILCHLIISALKRYITFESSWGVLIRERNCRVFYWGKGASENRSKGINYSTARILATYFFSPF